FAAGQALRPTRPWRLLGPSGGSVVGAGPRACPGPCAHPALPAPGPHAALEQPVKKDCPAMKDVVIVDAVPTPVGNHGGVFRDVDAKELARTVIRGLLDRTGLDPAAIDEVIFGCIAQPSDAPNITRVAALMAGIPKEVPGYTVARNCDSGMDAI